MDNANDNKRKRDPQEIGMWIKLMRKEKRMTQRQMAAKLGFSANYLAMIENGKRNASNALLRKLSKCLEVSVEDILYGPTVEEEKNLNEYLLLSKEFDTKAIADALCFARTYLEIVRKK